MSFTLKLIILYIKRTKKDIFYLGSTLENVQRLAQWQFVRYFLEIY